MECRGYFDGTADASLPGGEDLWLTRNRNEGYVQWKPSAAPDLTYDVTLDRWELDITSQIKVFDDTDTDVTGSATNVSGSIQESPDGMCTLAMQATYSGATKNTVLQWRVEDPAFSIVRPPLTKARVYAQLVNFDPNSETGSLRICSRPKQHTIGVSGTVTWELDYNVSSQTDSEYGTEIDYTVTMRVINNTTEDITVHYDPGDYPDHWFTYFGDLSGNLFTTATTYSVLQGATNETVILTRTGEAWHWGARTSIPDAVRMYFAGEQFAIGDTSTTQYDSGMLYTNFYINKQ